MSTTTNNNRRNKAQAQVVAIGETAPEVNAEITANMEPEIEETAEGLPQVEDTPQQVEPVKAEKPAGDKADGRGRPKGMLFSFTGAISDIITACPELKGLTHCLSQKRDRTEAEKAGLITARIAAGLPLDAEFLGTLMQEEIGDKLKLHEMAAKYGNDFSITLTRGAINKYFDDKREGVLHRLTKTVSPETPVAPGEAAKDENIGAE